MTKQIRKDSENMRYVVNERGIKLTEDNIKSNNNGYPSEEYVSRWMHIVENPIEGIYCEIPDEFQIYDTKTGKLVLNGTWFTFSGHKLHKVDTPRSKSSSIMWKLISRRYAIVNDNDNECYIL